MPHNRSEEMAPKPYDFVTIAKHVRRTAGPGHDRLALADRHTGWLRYTLEALTPIFVGTGSYALGEDAGFPGEKVVRPFYRVAGVPAIPGSSVKGMARSIVEAVSPSCLTATRVDTRALPDGTILATSYNCRCTPTEACPACSIFGRMSQLGKASFEDAYLVGSSKTQLFRLAPMYRTHAHEKPPAYMDQAGRFKGRKFFFHALPQEDNRQPPVEVLPRGARVQGRVDFANLSLAELGLLCLAMGLDTSVALKLGGGKPLGLGSLRLVGATLGLLSLAHFLQANAQETIYTGEMLGQLYQTAFDKAVGESLLLRDQARQLMRLLTFNRTRHAPTGIY